MPINVHGSNDFSPRFPVCRAACLVSTVGFEFAHLTDVQIDQEKQHASAASAKLDSVLQQLDAERTHSLAMSAQIEDQHKVRALRAGMFCVQNFSHLVQSTRWFKRSGCRECSLKTRHKH